MSERLLNVWDEVKPKKQSGSWFVVTLLVVFIFVVFQFVLITSKKHPEAMANTTEIPTAKIIDSVYQAKSDIQKQLLFLESKLTELKIKEAMRPTMDVWITSYSPTGNKTATGISTRKGSCAVDPKVIPIGTLIRFENFKGVPEWVMADDTGLAVKGPILDVYLIDGVISKTKAKGSWVYHERLCTWYLLVSKE